MWAGVPPGKAQLTVDEEGAPAVNGIGDSTIFDNGSFIGSESHAVRRRRISKSRRGSINTENVPTSLLNHSGRWCKGIDFLQYLL